MNNELKRLNCNNYHVCDLNDQDVFWFGCLGLRSLYNYSKNSDFTFKELCLSMIKNGQVIVNYKDGRKFVLTMI
jgi:hypothetical protein